MTTRELAERVMTLAHIDLDGPERQPDIPRWILATTIAIIGSLGADAALVALGEAMFPATKGYEHFKFPDYATLTVIGILIASVGWPVITRLTSTPRWLYARLAVLTTIVLLAPDVLIWMAGQIAQGVLVLMVMHLAIAVVTYFSMTRIAPAGPDATQ